MKSKFKTILAVSTFAIVITQFFVFQPNVAFACTCIESRLPIEELEKSTAVFTGKVIDIDVRRGIVLSSADPVKVTFDVSETWKGPDYKVLVVTTVRYSASCGYPFEQGEEYIVYARGEEDKLNTGICSRTKLLAAAEEDLATLGPGTMLSAQEQDDPVVELNNNTIRLIALGIGALAGALFLLIRFFMKRKND